MGEAVARPHPCYDIAPRATLLIFLAITLGNNVSLYLQGDIIYKHGRTKMGVQGACAPTFQKPRQIVLFHVTCLPSLKALKMQNK